MEEVLRTRELEVMPEYMLRIHLEYEYLTNGDINWVFGFCREAIKESLIEALEVDPEELRGMRIPLVVYSVRTGQSIEILIAGISAFAGGVIATVASELGKDIYAIMKRYLKNAFKRLKDRRPRVRRRNLTRRRVDLVKVPEGVAARRLEAETAASDEVLGLLESTDSIEL